MRPRPSLPAWKIVFPFSSLWCSGQIARRQMVVFLYPSLQTQKCLAQLILKHFARILLRRSLLGIQRFANTDPDLHAAEWQPVPWVIQPVTTKDYTRNNRFARKNAQRANPGPHRCSLQDRLRSRPNAALGEETDRSPNRQAGQCFTNGTSFCAVAPHRKSTESTHQRCAPSSTE